MLQFFVKASVEQNKKSESSRLKLRTLARPGIRLRPRRVIEPVSGKRERPMQGAEVGIARIFITVETEIGGLGERHSRKT